MNRHVPNSISRSRVANNYSNNTASGCGNNTQYKKRSENKNECWNTAAEVISDPELTDVVPCDVDP